MTKRILKGGLIDLFLIAVLLLFFYGLFWLTILPDHPMY